jgi:hypothetical protein
MRVLRQKLEKQEVGMKRPPVCADMSPRAEEHPLMEDAITQCSGDQLRTLVCVW